MRFLLWPFQGKTVCYTCIKNQICSVHFSSISFEKGPVFQKPVGSQLASRMDVAGSSEISDTFLYVNSVIFDSESSCYCVF